MNRLFSFALAAAAVTFSLGAAAQDVPGGPPVVPAQDPPPAINAVPEPASLLLVGVALAVGRGVTARRRRQSIKSKRAED